MAIRDWHGGQLVIFCLGLALLELVLYSLFQAVPPTEDPVAEYLLKYGDPYAQVRSLSLSQKILGALLLAPPVAAFVAAWKWFGGRRRVGSVKEEPHDRS